MLWKRFATDSKLLRVSDKPFPKQPLGRLLRSVGTLYT